LAAAFSRLGKFAPTTGEADAALANEDEGFSIDKELPRANAVRR
jgi:hypothetical protein